MKLAPNLGSDRAWVWNVSADYAEAEPTAETFAIRFANSESESPRLWVMEIVRGLVLAGLLNKSDLVLFLFRRPGFQGSFRKGSRGQLEGPQVRVCAGPGCR